MSKSVNLIELLPAFIQNYREINQIMKSETPEFQALYDELDIFRNNQFITSCDYTGIKRFENLLKINSGIYDTLELRRLRVLTRWSDFTPYTYNILIQKLDDICGKNNYEILNDFNNYSMKLTTHLSLYSEISQLDYMLSHMIPANIDLSSSNNISYVASAIVFTTSVNIETKLITIETKLKDIINSNANLIFTAVAIDTIYYTITT